MSRAECVSLYAYKSIEALHKSGSAEIRRSSTSRLRHFQTQSLVAHHKFRIPTELFKRVPNKTADPVFDDLRLSAAVDYDRHAAGRHRFHRRNTKVLRELREILALAITRAVPEDFRLPIEPFKLYVLDVCQCRR